MNSILIGELERVEIYRFNAYDGQEYVWDVTKAIRLTKGSEPELLRVLAAFTEEEIFCLYPELNREYAMTTDISKPALVVTFPDDEKVIIDGWHRLYKAFKSGADLPLIFLTPEQDKACRIS